MDCSPPGSSVQGILQARVLEWVAISFPRGPSWPRDQTHISCIAGEFFTVWATREVLVFRHKTSVVVGEETEAHWPPTPDFYLPVRGPAHTLLLSTPSGMSCMQAASCQCGGSQEPIWCLCRGGWPGWRAVDAGAGGGVWLEEQLLCVRVGDSQHWVGAPSWDSVYQWGTGRALCCPNGETGAETPPILERGGAWRPLRRLIHLPQELQRLVSSHSMRHQEGQQLGHLAAETPSTPATLRGTLPHRSCWEKE